jgi:hypothetical protein
VTDDELRATESQVKQKKLTAFDEARFNEIDELKKIFYEFFVREVLDNKKLKSYQGPKYYERDPDERDFAEQSDVSEEMGTHEHSFNTSL